MSMVVSYLVIVVLLGCSSHACNARSFGVVYKETAAEFQQKNQELDSARVSIQPDRKYSTLKDAKEESKFEEMKANSESNESGMHIQGKGGRKKDSLSYVSWRVPHDKKRGQQEPGFNLDYLPPKTHPPVHN